MSSQDALRRPAVDSRFWLYGAFILLAVGPLIAFTIGGLTSDSFSLEGPGGPIVAFSAGVLSFVSPCVLPIVPIYITHLSGATFENGRVAASRRVTFSHALAFITGLSLVFIVLGTSAGLLGSFFLQDNQRLLEQVAGFMLVAMAVLLVPEHGRGSPMRGAIALAALTAAFVFIAETADLAGDRTSLAQLGIALLAIWLRYSGYLPLSFFSRTFEVNVGQNVRSVGYGRSALVGGAFALGWTPCIGPILSGILTLAAATSSEVWTGTYLLVAYSAGFSIPFLLTGLAMSDAQGLFRKLQQHASIVEAVSAVMLVSVGLLLFFGKLANLSQWFDFAAFNEGL